MKAISDHIYYDPKRADRAKTVCTSTVLLALGITPDQYHYSGTERQMIGIARRKWSVRSCRSKLGKSATVGNSREALRRVAMADPEIVGFVVIVKGHALMLGCSGRTIVDTAPRKRDSRPILSIYAVRNKS
jgi:hypothetical protein